MQIGMNKSHLDRYIGVAALQFLIMTTMLRLIASKP
jgi:hypothetical protein